MVKWYRMSISIMLMIFVISSVSALAASIGNARVVLYPEVNGWTTTSIDRTLLLVNTNNVTVNVNLTVDDTTDQIITLDKKMYTLAPGEKVNATFTVKVKEEGNYESRINILFKPADPEDKESGVVLSSTVVVVAKKDQNYTALENGHGTGNAVSDNLSSEKILVISGLVIMIALILLIIYLAKKKRSFKGGVPKK